MKLLAITGVMLMLATNTVLAARKLSITGAASPKEHCKICCENREHRKCKRLFKPNMSNPKFTLKGYYDNNYINDTELSKCINKCIQKHQALSDKNS